MCHATVTGVTCDKTCHKLCQSPQLLHPQIRASAKTVIRVFMPPRTAGHLEEQRKVFLIQIGKGSKAQPLWRLLGRNPHTYSWHMLLGKRTWTWILIPSSPPTPHLTILSLTQDAR